jgi:DNA-binding transcriptional ArsR family regulator
VADRTHELFSTLGNPQRLAILVYLLEQQGRDVQQREILELDDLKGLHQSTVSQYLSALVKAGLVEKGRGKRGGYSALMQEKTSALVLLAAEISAGCSEATSAEDEGLRRRIRKAQMKVIEKDTDAKAS